MLFRSVLLFGLFQLACAAGFGALGAIPELPRWLELLFTALAVGCLSLTPYTTYSFFNNGRLVTHEIFSEKKFEKFLDSLPV